MSFRIGTDVGGTFTDFILVREGGDVRLLKVPTTLEDQSAGVMHGIAALAEQEGMSARELLAQTELVVHGTTTADNTMIEMNGAVTGLLTSANQHICPPGARVAMRRRSPVGGSNWRIQNFSCMESPEVAIPTELFWDLPRVHVEGGR